MPEEIKPDWEIELDQLRGLMRNVVANHERIRDRINCLKLRFLDGEMGEGLSWTAWAVGMFAYSEKYLAFMEKPHPLAENRWEKQRQEAERRLAEEALRGDRARVQDAWDSYQGERVHDMKLAQLAWDAWVKEDIVERRLKAARDLAKENRRLAAAKKPAKPKRRDKPLSIPPEPVLAAREHLYACVGIERRSRIELGREYAALRELAQAGKLGDDPRSGKPWSWVGWAEQYIERSRQDIARCIVLYEAKTEDDTSCVNLQESNVYSLDRSIPKIH